MTFELRLALLRFNGVQAFPGGPSLALFTDADTGSTFTVQKDQSVGEALAAFDLRWRYAESQAAQAEERAA